MIAAVIPTRFNPPQLAVLRAQLADDGVRTIVLPSDEYDHAIYRMWNAGVAMAVAEGADIVAILNDDVSLEPGTVPFLARALRSDPGVGVVYPDVSADRGLPPGIRLQDTRGTWGSGGMTGFCFAFKALEVSATFDSSYYWWYGDDAWEHDVRAEGWRVCRVIGVPVRHTPDGSASRDGARLSPLIAQDRARWEARL